MAAKRKPKFKEAIHGNKFQTFFTAKELKEFEPVEILEIFDQTEKLIYTYKRVTE